jgi:hypothetical protein
MQVGKETISIIVLPSRFVVVVGSHLKGKKKAKSS